MFESRWYECSGVRVSPTALSDLTALRGDDGRVAKAFELRVLVGSWLECTAGMWVMAPDAVAVAGRTIGGVGFGVWCAVA